MTEYDLIIIGAGPGGYVAAERAGHHGLKVLLIEKEALGGVCLNWGCIPTKALLASAKYFYSATHSSEFGVSVQGATFDLTAAMKRKAGIQEGLRKGIQGLMKKFKVEVVAGTARVVDAHTVAVGDIQYRAKHLMISTGSSPARPPIPGLDKPHVLDSNGILEIKSLPKALTIIGGGVIGLEFACFFAMVGVPVTVVEMMEEVLPGMDTDIAKLLRAELASKGVTFHLGCKVQRVDDDAVVFSDPKGAEQRAVCDMVLVAIGRRPNGAGLGLEEAGVQVERGAIPVDENCRTNVPSIYAVGDVTGQVLLAHTASRQGEVAVNHILGHPDRMRMHAIPGVVYTSPEVAVVGMSEAGAKKRGIPVKVGKMPMAASGRFLAEYSGKGLAKIVVHAETNVLLGVHIIGGAASEMIHGFTYMIENETRLNEIKETIFPHPTVSELVRDIAFTL
ncbi:MAG: dihydrolipoyl dehydrogenase [Planctomycetota bacterium]|nr:MAG: dihydrolipoyl dehydrogenase [Planctomycetota bacterium]